MILDFVVHEILNVANVLDLTQVKILDNSHDKGLIICRIIEIIISQRPKNLVQILENNIYFVKRNEIEFNQCVERLKKIEIKYNLAPIKWNIYPEATEVYRKLPDYFDIVLGKAPYIEVHNTIDDIDKYVFTNSKGITNSYTSEYFKEMKVLNVYGTLIYTVFNDRSAFFVNEYIKTKDPNAQINNLIHESKNEGSKIYISFIVATHSY